MAKSPQPRTEINLEEIYQILDSARRQPISEVEYETVKTAVAVLAEKAAPRSRTTEKMSAVLPHQNPDEPAAKGPVAKRKPAQSGHGRNPGSAFTGAHRVIVPHTTLQVGDTCPECFPVPGEVCCGERRVATSEGGNRRSVTHGC